MVRRTLLAATALVGWACGQPAAPAPAPARAELPQTPVSVAPAPPPPPPAPLALRPGPAPPWPCYRGNPARTGSCDHAPPLPSPLGACAWKVSLGGEIVSSAAITTDSAIAGACDGSLTAVSLLTGWPRWRVSLGSAVLSSPAVAGDLVVVGTSAGDLVACDLATGAIRWRSPLGGGVESSPAVVSELVLVGSRARAVHAVRLSDGSRAWRGEMPAPVFSSPAVADERVVAASVDGVVRAFALGDGRLLWEARAGDAPLYATPALSGGTVLLLSGTGTLLALDLADGRRLREHGPLAGESTTSPAVRDGLVVAVGYSSISAFDLGPDPEIRWTLDAPDGVRASPVLAGDAVLLGAPDGSVRLLDAANGAVFFQHLTRGPVWASPSPHPYGYVVGSADGWLYAMRDPRGDPRLLRELGLLEPDPSTDGGDFAALAQRLGGPDEGDAAERLLAAGAAAAPAFLGARLPGSPVARARAEELSRHRGPFLEWRRNLLQRIGGDGGRRVRGALLAACLTHRDPEVAARAKARWDPELYGPLPAEDWTAEKFARDALR